MEYIKPEIEIKEVSFLNEIAAGVNDWLGDNNMTDAGITSFFVAS